MQMQLKRCFFHSEEMSEAAEKNYINHMGRSTVRTQNSPICRKPRISVFFYPKLVGGFFN